jgi:uncharacterized membrane protein YcaP (DUF421 family)
VELVIRTTVVYWFLWLVLRGSGKRSLAQLTTLDMLVIVIIGDIVQQGITQEDMSVTGAALVVAVIVLWTLVVDRVSRSSPALSRVVNGEPVILIRHGTIFHDRMEAEQLSLDDLREAAREKGIGSLDDVELCVLETDGSFSFVGGTR